MATIVEGNGLWTISDETAAVLCDSDKIYRCNAKSII